jgi:hypothetical protein
VVGIRHLWVKSLKEERVRRRLKISKPKEPKWIVVVGSKGTCVKKSCTSGGSTSGGSKCKEFETLESQRTEVSHSR